MQSSLVLSLFQGTYCYNMYLKLQRGIEIFDAENSAHVYQQFAGASTDITVFDTRRRFRGRYQVVDWFSYADACERAVLVGNRLASNSWGDYCNTFQKRRSFN